MIMQSTDNKEFMVPLLKKLDKSSKK